MSGSYRASTVERALHSVLRAGPNGAPPQEELAALRAARSETVPALAERLSAAEPAELAATIRLVRLMGVPELTDAIVAMALRRPAPLEAKVEAIETLREAGVEVPAAVQETLDLARSFVSQPGADALERVLALPETWRMPVIEAWLAGDRAPAAELLDRVLGEDPVVDERVIDLLGGSGAPEAAAVLRDIAERTDSKTMRKLARRGLHRLRSLGVEIDEAAVDGPGFSLAIEADPRRESRAWITGIDGDGGRIAWVLSPSPSGGDRLLEVVLDDVEGVRKAELMAVTRKGFRTHVDRLRANPGILVVQAELPQIAVRLVQAERRTAASSAELPDDYRKWRREVGDRLLEDAPDEGAAVQLSVLDAADLQTIRADRDLLQASADLLKEPYFASWSLPGPLAEAAARGVRRAETSDLVVDDEQRKQQVDQAVAGAAAAFDEDLRQRYRRRLEEMAEILWSSRRQDQARLALAAAMAFTEVTDLYAAHPFARALIQRGVLVSYQGLREQEEQERGGSRISRP